MGRVTTVSDSIIIHAPAAVIHDLVSDPTQMGRWSPENVGATVIDPGTGPAHEGMVFDGHNTRGFRPRWNLAMPRWTTRCVVIASVPGERFAFKVVGQRMGGAKQPRLRFPIATWEYRFEPVEGGTRVTETWTDDRGASWFGRSSRAADRIFTGGSTFPELSARNIRATLDRLKEVIEREVETT